ncbi:hypothetical protein BC351_32015 [Paenibacillus ferrarius]|uniref:Uncharacterized protein n=1 Tax=Paenibacillus ferrarius TaxID=1469647 RepID=A0A1V4HF40_9BACL|nr:hypothetical protein BC351_32015 [Paenibacillus ferrarius]
MLSDKSEKNVGNDAKALVFLIVNNACYKKDKSTKKVLKVRLFHLNSVVSRINSTALCKIKSRLRMSETVKH